MKTLRFEQAANEWLNLKKDELRQISYEKYRQVYDAHLIFFNDMKISSIRENDINEFMLKKEKKEKLSESILYTIQFVLKAILEYSHKQYNIDTVKIKNRAKPKTKPTVPVLTDLQKDMLVKYVFENINSISISVILSMFMGLKTGEICALTKKNIDFKKNIIHITKTVERVRDANNKTNLKIFEIDNKFVKREVPIPKSISNYINQYVNMYEIKNNCYLISQTDLISDPRKIQKELNLLCKSLSIKCDFNILRNTFIYTCLKNNMNIKFLCKILGSQNFKRIYGLCPDIENSVSNLEMEKCF